MPRWLIEMNKKSENLFISLMVIGASAFIIALIGDYMGAEHMNYASYTVAKICGIGLGISLFIGAFDKKKLANGLDPEHQALLREKNRAARFESGSLGLFLLIFCFLSLLGIV